MGVEQPVEKKKLKRKEYEKKLRDLSPSFATWTHRVKSAGARIIIVLRAATPPERAEPSGP